MYFTPNQIPYSHSGYLFFLMLLYLKPNASWLLTRKPGIVWLLTWDFNTHSDLVFGTSISNIVPTSVSHGKFENESVADFAFGTANDWVCQLFPDCDLTLLKEFCYYFNSVSLSDLLNSVCLLSKMLVPGLTQNSKEDIRGEITNNNNTKENYKMKKVGAIFHFIYLKNMDQKRH